MINYSIIIPHKNSVKSLLRLLHSIPDNQEFQVIIIDDNSKSIIQKELQKIEFNANIEIIFCEISKGAGGARNIGLKHAKGKWLLFADSDDYFTNNFEDLIAQNLDSSADIVYFNTDSCNESGEKSYRHFRYSKLVNNFLKYNKEQALRYFFTPPWAKMINRKLIVDNNISFDQVPASNDIMFSLRVAYHAKKIEASNEILYIITLSTGSVTNVLSKSYFDSKFNVALKANNFLCSIGMRKYQQSILYFLGKSSQFGFKYVAYVILMLIKNKSNIFIGADKFMRLSSVLRQRENINYIIKKKD